MKKLILILLLGALVLLCLFGCDRADSNQDETTTTTNESTAPDATIPEGTTSANTPDESTEPDNNQNDTSTDAPIYERSPELDEFFKLLEGDAYENDKFGFSINYEDLYFELKNSGEYEECPWDESALRVIINCDYEYATEEKWYSRVASSDLKALNAAFYNQYSSTFPNGEFVNISFCSGFHLRYYQALNEFEVDYSAIKSLLDLEYVTGIHVTYTFGLPQGYQEE